MSIINKMIFKACFTFLCCTMTQFESLCLKLNLKLRLMDIKGDDDHDHHDDRPI